MNLFLFLGIAFAFIFFAGRIIEKIRVPWIFAALIFGSLLSIYNPVPEITTSQAFNVLAQLGMYFLLFIIGFEINLKQFKKASRFFVNSTLFIILFEAAIGSTVIHFVFGYEWLISIIVASSFATVGEAILLPILDEFKIVNTKLGQSIIAIGTLDDIIEILVLILTIIVIGMSNSVQLNYTLVFISLSALFVLAFLLARFKERNGRFDFLSIEMLFLFTVFILFIFLGIGEYANATAIAALLAGIALKAFLPGRRLKAIESEVRTMCYGFFAPIFFLWVGTTIDMRYLLSSPLLILLIVAVSGAAKILGSYIAGFRYLGLKNSLLLGIGLSVRFSTSIVIVKLLFDNGLIRTGLYSVIIASTIVFTFLIPVLFSNLLSRIETGK
jgi:Kef-type K+ transport system membrane component KefB